MKSYRNARIFDVSRSTFAIAAAIGAFLYAGPSHAQTSLIDFEKGFTKGMQVSRQFEASHGIKLAIVDGSTGRSTSPRIGETFETDPGCSFDGLSQDAGCGQGSSDAWTSLAVSADPLSRSIRYYDRMTSALEPLTGRPHKELVGRYFLAYPPGVNASDAYFQIAYTRPTKKATFGLIDVDGVDEKWEIRVLDKSGDVVATQLIVSNPDNRSSGDGALRIVQLDLSGTPASIHEIQVHFLGGQRPGVGIDYISPRSNVSDSLGLRLKHE